MCNNKECRLPTGFCDSVKNPHNFKVHLERNSIVATKT